MTVMDDGRAEYCICPLVEERLLEGVVSSPIEHATPPSCLYVM